ncbi:hypothetical protein ABZP36_019570 [Zizania latifolia]
MAKDDGSPPSRLDSDPDPDDFPLTERRRRLLRPPVKPAPPAPERRVASAAAEGARGAAQQGWPGLPRGAQFNPSDSDLLWHLAAEVGNGKARRHPFISEFIKSVDETIGLGCTHPQDIPGIRQDGFASYFFHKNFKVCNNENDKYISWQKSGNPISIVLDGYLQGCKEVFVLYAYETDGNSPKITDWRLHQYHIKNTEKDEGELVVLKIFHKSEKNQFECDEEAHAQSTQGASATNDDSKEKLQLENHSSNMATESGFVQGNENKQKQMQEETCPDQNKLNSFNVACNVHIKYGNQINDHDEIDELDHMSLQERYRILLAEKHYRSAEIYGLVNSCRSHEGTAFKDDMHSMLQEISSAPPIRGFVSNDCSRSLLAEGPSNNQRINEAERDSTPTRGAENIQLQGRNDRTFLVDVKLEPTLEGMPEVTSSHVEGPLPSLEIKTEVTGCELPGIHDINSINIAELTVKNIHTLNHDGGLAYCSQQRKRRKIVREGDAYFSCRRRRKKTATDSIERALEEDAPGLLQILLDRGILVNEIKLYGVEEDDDMLPNCTESDFQDLENVIIKLFPQRTSLLKLAARNSKEEKAIYCLACLISLIEQSRYLQFRDCPVEWGWCRDLQSFIFVFKSHNRIVLERPEYGYATYFFEIVQSLPIEWQIQRLVTAMKISGCGRTALIENKPLLVGEDLSEGEARVLEEYGWIPNSGISTMLNYRDRVIHDRWNEKSGTDWKMKIGKLLMNGYSEGQLVLSRIPKKVGKLSEEGTEIRLEDPL